MKNENQFVKGFKSGFKNFSHNITNIVNFILLFFVYFIGIGATSVVAKISKKRFLELKQEGETYWKDKPVDKKPVEEYYRQF